MTGKNSSPVFSGFFVCDEIWKECWVSYVVCIVEYCLHGQLFFYSWISFALRI